jgi:hypothetical protein
MMNGTEGLAGARPAGSAKFVQGCPTSIGTFKKRQLHQLFTNGAPGRYDFLVLFGQPNGFEDIPPDYVKILVAGRNDRPAIRQVVIKGP